MHLVFHIPSERRATWWVEQMRELMPEATVCKSSDDYERAHIDYAIVWRPPNGWLASHPNLKAVVSIGAGVDHVLENADFPGGVDLIRTTGDELTQRMREYVALHVLRHHRLQPELERQAEVRRWKAPITPPATRRGVGVMGLGNLGLAAATTLRDLGFDVHGWARSRHDVDGVRVHAGESEFDAFLAASEILVCLLPLTEATRGILNAELFGRLPDKACLVNAARGEHLVEDDLIPALDTGTLAAATLDVFHEEPLPDTHPFWGDPRITITPHNASQIDPESGGRLIAENIRRHANATVVEDQVDLERGY